MQKTAAAGESEPLSASVKRVTIVDVAKAAGVSVSSASRALSKPGRLNAHTEARIREVAKNLGYRPHPAARALPTGRTGTLAIVVANIANPVSAQVIRGADNAARELGYTLLIHEFRNPENVESEHVDRLAGAVDGFILTHTDAGDTLVRTLANARPSVMVNRDITMGISVSGKPQVGLASLMDTLAAGAHSRALYVSGPKCSWINGERLRAARVEADSHGIALDSIGPFAPTREGGASAADAVLATHATAIIAYNDLMAIGLMHELQRRGVHIPNDLSIVGFDNIFGGDFTTPPLTTIHVPLEEMAYGATVRLAAILEGREAEPSAQVDTTLILRGSTGPAPASARSARE